MHRRHVLFFFFGFDFYFVVLLIERKMKDFLAIVAQITLVYLFVI